MSPPSVRVASYSAATIWRLSDFERLWNTQKPQFVCATRKQTRWEWCTTAIISPGLKWAEWICAASWDSNTRKMEVEDDSYIVVADAHCRFKRPARFDDLLVVRTKVLASQRRTVKFGYEIVHQSRAK